MTANRRLTLDEAWLYCACLFEDRYSDWRLPNADEANDMLDAVWEQMDDINGNFYKGNYTLYTYYAAPMRDGNASKP